MYMISHRSYDGLLFLDTPVSSTNKTDCHDITEILLIVAFNTITLTEVLQYTKIFFIHDTIEANKKVIHR
jgi:hypothetical protein